MHRSLLAVAGSLVLLVVLLGLLANTDAPRPSVTARPNSTDVPAEAAPLTVYCAAANRGVLEAVRQDYLAEYGVPLEIQYGPSQTLLSALEISRTGDLYLPADDSFLQLARERQLAAEVLPLAQMRAVIAVRRDFARPITSLQDVLQPDLRLVQANVDAAAIGRVTRQVLQQRGLWESLDRATTAYRTTIADVANDVVVGAADAGIVYDAVLHGYPDLRAVLVPELADVVSQVSLGVLSSSRQPQAALHFARYVAARDRGLQRFAEHGFRPAVGDLWSDVPELTVFAGSMLRPAIDDSLTEFEQREGIRVTRVYNGCGILVAQMQAGQHPDAYFACDTEFMQQVPELFPTPVDVSRNELVILVQKGNPHRIQSLRDLGRQGLRIGIGHEKQCAMGWLTQNTLRAGGVQQEVMQNVTVQTPTGDMLVNQLKAGSLDAAVAYLSNAAGAGDVLDAIQIQGLSCAVATQPLAIAAETRYPQLTARLLQHLCSETSRQRFEAEGFRWQWGSPHPDQARPHGPEPDGPASDSQPASAADSSTP